MAWSGNDFNWSDDRKKKMNCIAHDWAKALRVGRKVLKLVGPQGAYVDHVTGHLVDHGKSLSIKPNQSLQPLQISRHFFLFPEEVNDDDALQRLVGFATADLAFAEDAVILLGAEAGPFLKRLEVELDNPNELNEQVGLFDKDQPAVTHPILDSINEAIFTQLGSRGQFGDYFAIVSPALYQEALTDIEHVGDFPLPRIESVLRENGFLYSQALEGKRGVVCSGARGTINLAVPVDIHVELLPFDDKNRPQLRVAQQFRLVIDDPEAKQALR